MMVAVMILLSEALPGVRLSITRSPPVSVRLMVFATVIEALAEEELEAVSAWVGVSMSPEQAIMPTRLSVIDLDLSSFMYDSLFNCNA